MVGSYIRKTGSVGGRKFLEYVPPLNPLRHSLLDKSASLTSPAGWGNSKVSSFEWQLTLTTETWHPTFGGLNTRDRTIVPLKRTAAALSPANLRPV